MRLSDIFDAVAYKQLRMVDLPNIGSNQHEINAVKAFRDFFGTTKTEGYIHWYYFEDDAEVLNSTDKFTLYDARAESYDRTGRSEWRLYYYGSFLSKARIGDWLILARIGNKIFGLIFEQDSVWWKTAQVLFGFNFLLSTTMAIRPIPATTLNEKSVDFVGRRILEELEIEYVFPTSTSDEDLITKKFPNFRESFPTTLEMSNFASENVEIDVYRPDDTLIRLLNREETFFITLESLLIREKLAEDFESVDDFIRFSMSVHQRRRSRMGHAFENHLAYIFNLHNLKYDRQAFTEGKKKPDFLFPGREAYLNPEYDENLLFMLAAKSTCKERWPQVLTEANRISKKHLCTLETGISVQQTQEMKQRGLILVVPEPLQETYLDIQKTDLWTLTSFINFIKSSSQV
ncbi:MAG: hypothetical protein K8F30_05540 [Taibaiella sp.]|nr:hypothetical protein [Taibaiella sp.]